MASNIQQFEQLIGQILSTDNAARQQAEAAFNETKKNPDLCILSLLELVRSSQHEQVRGLALVLIRRTTRNFKESLYPHLSPQAKSQLAASLLEFLEKETINHIRKKIADCISELAATIFDDSVKGTWDELLPFLFKCTKSPSEGHRESALLVFEQLSTEIGPQLVPHFQILKSVFAAGMQDETSLKVRVAALAATATYIRLIEDSRARQELQQLIPLMLGTVSAALNAQKEEEAQSAIKLFVELGEMDPLFLKPYIEQITNAMMMIASAQQLEDNTRQVAVEFLLTLAENKPGMVRKIPKYLDTLIPIIIHMMLQVEDDDQWNQGLDEDDDDVDITDSDIGEEALDRICLALGGKNIVPMIFSQNVLPTLLADQDWKKRHTGLMVLSIMAEGTQKEFIPRLSQIVPNVCKFIQDPHPRVRWAACNALGQMASDFGGDFQNKYHADTVQSLLVLMADKSNPRVQSHSAAALINFCEQCEPEILIPYLNAIFTNLVQLLQEGKVIVQEQSVTAIAAVADCIQEQFVNYYDHVMPYLKNILANANGKEHRMLRGKTMECITLIGVAVGKAKFYQDAKEVMEQMNKTQSSQLEPDDPQVSFLLQSWARVCRCMGQDFVPYLQYVMPPLLVSANISPDITISDADSKVELPEGYETISVGDKRIGINTSALEEKATACNMIFCYASELREGFFPYVDEVAKLLVPLMKFYYNDGVRQAATTTMPHLLTSAIMYFKTAGAATGADTMYIKNMWNFMFPNFIDSIKDESDSEILCDSIEGFISVSISFFRLRTFATVYNCLQLLIST